MPARSTTDLLSAARRGGYAVAAINVVDELSLRAVCAAAEQARSPLIVQTSVKTVRTLGADYLSSSFRRVAARASVPLALHLDHCGDRAVLSTCIAQGWNSVLFDASDRAFDTAVAETIEVVAEAHAVGVAVESEIENIAGVEDDVGAELEGQRYAVEQIRQFVTTTGADAFAPALGTAHGLYRSRPRLDPERAKDLARVLDVPLVLHGGTGLTDSEFRAFIGAGCAKVNISTSLKHAYLRSALAFLQDAAAVDHWDPPALFQHVERAVRDDAAGYFTTFGSRDAVRAS